MITEDERLMLTSILKAFVKSGESDERIRKHFDPFSTNNWNDEQLKEVAELQDFCDKFLKEKNNE